MERITQQQADRLPQIPRFNGHCWSLAGLKQCCPFVLSTGVYDGKAYATTRAMPNVGKIPKGRTLEEMIKEQMPAHAKAHFHYAETETQAAYQLIIKQEKQIVQSQSLYANAFGFKLRKYSNAEPKVLNAALLTL